MAPVCQFLSPEPKGDRRGVEGSGVRACEAGRVCLHLKPTGSTSLSLSLPRMGDSVQPFTSSRPATYLGPALASVSLIGSVSFCSGGGFRHCVTPNRLSASSFLGLWLLVSEFLINHIQAVACIAPGHRLPQAGSPASLLVSPEEALSMPRAH